MLLDAETLWLTCRSVTSQRSLTRILQCETLILTTQELAHHVVPNLNVEVFVPPMTKVQRWDLSWLITLLYKSCPRDQSERFLW